jgi:hypothetical protein
MNECRLISIGDFRENGILSGECFRLFIPKKVIQLCVFFPEFLLPLMHIWPLNKKDSPLIFVEIKLEKVDFGIATWGIDAIKN